MIVRGLCLLKDKLIKSLRYEPLAYFNARAKKANSLITPEVSLLEEILSTRKSEELYKNKKLGTASRSRS